MTVSIRHALLELISEEPRSSAHLQAAFEAVTQDVWPINVGQVYQTLKRLERDGLVEVPPNHDSGARGRPYQITQAGQRELEHWWLSPVTRPEDDRQELVIKIAMAAQRPELDTALIIHRQREAAMRQLRDIMGRRSSAPRERTAEQLLTERHIFEIEAELRWLDHVESLPDPTPAKENS